MTKLCVQDVLVISKSRCKKGDDTARVLFDSGSQTTLVRNKFAEQAGWSYSKARYSLAGIGDKAKTIYGKLWNISLKDNKGKVHTTKAYGVTSILQEDWAFPAINEVAAQFPNIPKDVFLAQHSKPLDILIGSDALSLLPKCNYGPDCKDCRSGLCCYQSKFGLGWVPVD